MSNEVYNSDTELKQTVSPKQIKKQKIINGKPYCRKDKSLEGLSNDFLSYFINVSPLTEVRLDKLTTDLGVERRRSI